MESYLFDTLNFFNPFTPLNSLGTLKALNALNALNAFNALNALNTLNTLNSFIVYLSFFNVNTSVLIMRNSDKNLIVTAHQVIGAGLNRQKSLCSP